MTKYVRDGRNGRDGMPGMPGPIPKHEWQGTHIRFQKNDGGWSEWVNLLGEEGKIGPQGKSAYDIAVEKGFSGSVEEFLMSLKGDQGRTGKSAYTIALESGFRGTPTEWLLSLNGKDGAPGREGKRGEKGIGERGSKGEKGEDGLSAYEVWLSLGYTGTEEDFFEWLAEKIKEKIKVVTEIRGGGSLRLKLSHLVDVDVSGVQDGDRLAYQSGKWIPLAGGGGGAVDSVNGQTGVVSLDTNDVPEGSTNLYYEDSRVQEYMETVVTGGIDVDSSGNFSVSENLKSTSFGIVVDGGGAEITTGLKKYLVVPYNMTITGWTIISNAPGDCVIDVWKSDYANFPPTSGNSITGTEKPTLSSLQIAQDNALSTWSVNVLAGDIVAFNVDSADTVEWVSLTINGVKT